MALGHFYHRPQVRLLILFAVPLCGINMRGLQMNFWPLQLHLHYTITHLQAILTHL
jgi:hypothetical protein